MSDTTSNTRSAAETLELAAVKLQGLRDNFKFNVAVMPASSLHAAMDELETMVGATKFSAGSEDSITALRIEVDLLKSICKFNVFSGPASDIHSRLVSMEEIVRAAIEQQEAAGAVLTQGRTTYALGAIGAIGATGALGTFHITEVGDTGSTGDTGDAGEEWRSSPSCAP